MFLCFTMTIKQIIIYENMLIYYIVNVVNLLFKPLTCFGHILTTFRVVIYDGYIYKAIKPVYKCPPRN